MDFVPLLVRAHRGQGRWRDLDLEVEGAEASRVHEPAGASLAGQERADVCEGLLGGGKPQALERTAGQGLEPFQ